MFNNQKVDTMNLDELRNSLIVIRHKIEQDIKLRRKIENRICFLFGFSEKQRKIIGEHIIQYIDNLKVD